jgi:uncharacterized membrane protein YfcA
MEHTEDRNRFPKKAVLSAVIVLCVTVAVIAPQYGRDSLLDVVKATDQYVVPENEKFADYMQDFEESVGRETNRPVTAAVEEAPQHELLASPPKPAASGGSEGTSTSGRNTEQAATRPQTPDGNSARDAANNAVSDLQKFEALSSSKSNRAAKHASAAPQATLAAPQATSAAPQAASAAPQAVATAEPKVGDLVEDAIKTHKAQKAEKAKKVADENAHHAPSSMEVDHAEKSAARASSGAVDDLSNFEKALSKTKKTQHPAIVVKKHLPKKNLPPQQGVSSMSNKLSPQEWGRKEVLMAKGVVTWLEPDSKGQTCDEEYERQQCGNLYCNANNTCQFCKQDADCHSPRYRCFGPQKSACSADDQCECHHKNLFPMVGADAEAMVLAFLATALAASGGIGGGGLLVPLFILVEDFEADLASPLSSATITGGAVVGYALYGFRWHPLYPAVQRPLIDYETVLIMLPSLLTGTMIGTIFDKILPLWFIMTMLFLLLGFSTVRTCQKGIQALEQENEATETLQDVDSNTESKDDTSLLEGEEKIVGTRFPLHTLGLIVLFWVFVGVIALLKGGNYAMPSILPFVKCNNAAYWVLQVFCWGAMFIVFIFVRDQVLHHGEGGLDGDVVWTPTNSITLPMLCFPCGIFAGLLGVGGGMVVGPLLLELGARHSTVSATSTFTILVTASSSAVQFILMGKLPPFYAAFFAVIGGFGTLVGQVAVENIIKRYNSTSIIVFGISAVICSSTIAMGYTGVRSIVRIAEVGGNMGLRDLCA